MPPLLRLSPKQIILLAAGLLLIGLVLAWLMVLKLIAPSFFLALLTFLSSTGGLIIGIIGMALYGIEGKKKDDDSDGPNFFDFDR